MEKVDQSGDCWLWTAARFTNGYGAFRDGNRQRRAHRVSYELHVGPIPDGAVLMHACDTRLCVNPGHLRPGTQKDNQQDMATKGRSLHGDRNWNRHNPKKLGPAPAAEIRERYLRGGITQRELAAEYGVSQSMVSLVVLGREWPTGSPQS